CRAAVLGAVPRRCLSVRAGLDCLPVASGWRLCSDGGCGLVAECAVGRMVRVELAAASAAVGTAGFCRAGRIRGCAGFAWFAATSFAPLIEGLSGWQTCPRLLAHAYNRRLFKQEVRYAAGSRSSQPAAPT